MNKMQSEAALLKNRMNTQHDIIEPDGTKKNPYPSTWWVKDRDGNMIEVANRNLWEGSEIIGTAFDAKLKGS